MPSLFTATAAVSSSLLLACPELAESHAVLLEPPSRNYVANKAGNENCPHCLQGGGPTQVKARGTGVWPTYLEPSSHGICGDPVQGKPDPASLASSPYMMPTEVQRTYQAGEVVEFRIGMNAHHKGHYEFRICDMALDGSKLRSAEEGQNCLNKVVLERAPLDESCGNGNSKADCQPIDEKHPGRWYLPPPNKGTMVADADFHDEDAPNSVTEYHVMKYKIPEDLSCTHCTLQWYWSTGNTCLYDADYLGPDGYFQRNSGAFQALGWNAAEWCPFCVSSWATCGNACCKTGGTFGEEFWNCADIAVSASGSGGGGSSPTPAPTMQSTTVRPTTMTTTAATTATTTQEGGGGGSTGTTCRARAGNVLSATDAKCTTACEYLPAGTWPCTVDGPCDCSGSSATTARPEPAPEPAPEPEPEPAPTTATTTAAPATTAAPSCVGAWGKCGGKNWAGASCCVSGYRCNFQNEWYSQCIPR